MADDIGMVLLASEAWPTAAMAREVPGPARDVSPLCPREHSRAVHGPAERGCRRSGSSGHALPSALATLRRIQGCCNGFSTANPSARAAASRASSAVTNSGAGSP
jgi:hypothetical protein